MSNVKATTKMYGVVTFTVLHELQSHAQPCVIILRHLLSEDLQWINDFESLNFIFIGRIEFSPLGPIDVSNGH